MGAMREVAMREDAMREDAMREDAMREDMGSFMYWLTTPSDFGCFFHPARSNA
jgi:hypothetical protein